MTSNAVTLADITSADWSLMLDNSGQPGSGLGRVVQGLADVAQCIRIILTTPLGSDLLRPTFGCDLFQFIDKPTTTAVPALVAAIADALELWEPRVKLLQVLAQPLSDQGGAHLEVTLVWQLRLGAGAYSAVQKITVTV
ncbi:MAG: GPW/gp25 family protein [Candidatus Binataceae bacterium]